jgi:uncharacterized SAM-binding protein YcdF (DUF218 family)
MLDPTLCSRPLTHWLVMKTWLSHVLMHRSVILPLLLTGIIAPWLVLKLKRQRFISGLSAIVLLFYILAGTPPMLAVADWGLVNFLPADSGVPTDAIVILGRGLQFSPSRVDVAAKLWQDKRAPKIFVSGEGDAPQIVELLLSKGIPAQTISSEACSQTTQENALFTAVLLQPLGVKSILLITDPPHMLRSLLTYRSLGFTVIPHPSPLPPLQAKREALIVWKEYLGMVSYGLKGRFLPQQPKSELFFPEAQPQNS